MTDVNLPPLDGSQLEAWLRKLENALGDVSIVDRSDIVMEMNAHIRDSYERGGRTLDEILASLGEPVQVANRYRMERGMQPVVIPKSQTPAGAFFKWATIGILGFITILTIGALILVTSLFPLVKVDEKKNRVEILGGMIDIKDADVAEEISEGLGDADINLNFGGQDAALWRRFEAELPGPVDSIVFTASNGDLEVESYGGRGVAYKCKVMGGPDSNESFALSPGNELALDLSAYKGVNCKMKVPAQAALKVEIANGDVSLKDMRNPVAAKLDNGRIVFGKHPSSRYTMKAEVANGLVLGLNDFEESQKSAPKAKNGEVFTADLQVTNGGIHVE